MIYPKKLQAGAVVGVVAPSSPVSEKRVRECCTVLKNMGFRSRCADNLSTSKGGYLAGDARVRGEWINRMFADSDIDAIFCIRGGDGSNQIMKYLDLDVIRENKKIFVGYSDITNLHLVFNQQCDLVTFHGPMVSSNMVDRFDPESRVALYEALMAESEYLYHPPAGQPLKIARGGSAEGILTGGNLTLLATSIGTPYEAELDGKILFIEEISGHIGNMDRNIYQLRNAGKLKNVQGILLGQFTGCSQDADDYGIVEVVAEATADLNIPILYNVQSGHGFPMITLPMGAKCQMNTKIPMIRFEVKREKDR